MRNACSRFKTRVIEALQILATLLILIVFCWFKHATSPVSKWELEAKLDQLNQHNSAALNPKSYPDPAAEFVMGVVSAPASGGVAQSLARLLVSSKVRPPPRALAPD